MCVSSVDTSVLICARVLDLPTCQSAKKGASAYIMSLFRGTKHKSTAPPRSEQTETSSAYEDAQVFYRMCYL
jgi:hypothetical protein